MSAISPPTTQLRSRVEWKRAMCDPAVNAGGSGGACETTTGLLGALPQPSRNTSIRLL